MDLYRTFHSISAFLSNGIISDTLIAVRFGNIMTEHYLEKKSSKCLRTYGAFLALIAEERFVFLRCEKKRAAVHRPPGWRRTTHFWQSDGVNLWSGSVKQKIRVHWSLITAACIRSLSCPDLCVSAGNGLREVLRLWNKTRCSFGYPMSSRDSKLSSELLCTELSIQHGSATVAHDRETQGITNPTTANAWLMNINDTPWRSMSSRNWVS